jgi:putative endonuclease
MVSRRVLSRQTGSEAEDRAAQFLRDSGYSIVARNFSTKWGEIDIVARDKEKVCFIEVKMRSTCSFGSPAQAVSYPKQRRIAMAAIVFMKQRGLGGCGARFDVVSMVRSKLGWKIDLYRNAFEFPF